MTKHTNNDSPLSGEKHEEGDRPATSPPSAPTAGSDAELMEEYSSKEGPICPNPKCGRQYTADEGYWHDESGFEMECDECGLKFFVQPYIRTTWRTIELRGQNTVLDTGLPNQ